MARLEPMRDGRLVDPDIPRALALAATCAAAAGRPPAPPPPARSPPRSSTRSASLPRPPRCGR
ncbi:MAG: hypothetical protein H6705_04225 [Myxococcales bacterium]|nr:hypothetical protein [Myxococcales bacterium]